MPEIKSNFSGGRMDKDRDERILPSSLYREALNVTVSNSEDSNVGSVQNLLSNVKVTEAISGPMVSGACLTVGGEGVRRKYFGHNKHIAAVIDPQNDKMYRFVTTADSDTDDKSLTFSGVWMDRIIEYDTKARKEVPWWEKEKSVVVDIWRVDTIISTIHHPDCGGSVITVCKNAAQIRHNMALLVSQEFHARVVSVSHLSNVATITLDKNISTLSFVAGDSLTFVSDRNLNFDVNRSITAINVIDNMLFWTDNYSEPKKINVKRSKMGSDSYYWSTKLGDTVVPFNTAGFEGTMQSTINTAGVYTQGHSAYSDFDQHTLLVVEDEIVFDSDKLESNCPVTGCMDPLYTLYNPWATVECDPAPDGNDPGCCGALITSAVIGCMDDSQFNYDEDATIHCISCCIPFIYGCMDDTASNYDAAANTNEVSASDDADPCIAVALGCMDPSAFNYDPAATSDDGSCVAGVSGCTTTGFCNYNASANIDDNSCSNNPTNAGSITTGICATGSYTWPANGQTYTTAQSGVTVVSGCNTATLNLTIDSPTNTGSITTGICDGTSYTWAANGQTYTSAQSGVTYVTGCNTATLNLTINPLTTNGDVTTSICDGDAYTWSLPLGTGSSYTSAQTNVTNVVGCNTATLNLTIDPLPTITSTITTVCVGSTITLTGSATAHLTTPWSSATETVATVTNAGVVTGVADGTSVITYMNSNNCITTVEITVTTCP